VRVVRPNKAGIQPATVAQRVERWTCDKHKVVGLAPTPTRTKLRNNFGQVVHSYVPFSPSNITWYRPRCGDALRLGR